MNRSSTRLAIVGGVVLLVACAIALAQHDARKRARTASNSQGSAPQGAKPIEVGADWQRESETLRVRANNDGLSEVGLSEVGLPDAGLADAGHADAGHADPGLGNPMRSDASGAMHAVYTADEAGENATLAAAEGISDLPPWLGNNASSGSLSDSSPSMPSLPQGGLPSTMPGNSSYPSTANNTGLVGLPNLDGAALPPPGLDGSPNEALGANQSLADAMPSGNYPSDNYPSANNPAANNLPTTLPSIGSDPGGPGKAFSGGPSAEGQGSYATGSPAIGQLNSPTPAAPADSSRPTASISVTGAPAPSYSLSDTQRPRQLATDLTGSASSSFSDSQNTSAYNSNQLGGTQGTQTNLGRGAPGANDRSYLGSSQRVPNTLASSQQNYGNQPQTYGNQTQVNGSQTQVNAQGLSPTSYNQPANPGANYSQAAPVPGSAAGQTARASVPGQLVSNRPGDRYLNGSQNPALIIERRSPDEIQVGKKATFILTVRNAGNATAHNVTVMDSVPKGAKFVGSVPSTTPTQDGIIRWQLGEIVAGDERTITLQLVPQVQGEMGSTASVNFATQASVRTIAVQPKLEILLETNPEVLIQDTQIINVTLRNTGTGVAKGVRLEADIPQQLKHESGDAQLEAVLGDVGPNETKRISLSCNAIVPGMAQCVVRAISVDGVQAEQRASLEVKSPKLAAAIEGPKLRYLERQATFNLAVKNVGTADASDLEFVVHLPTGLKFNAANNRGTYDPQTHTVTWAILGDLPAGRVAPMQLTVMPVDLGSQQIKLSAKGRLGIAADAKTELKVQGLSELAFNISQDNGTIEVGSSSTYSVQIMNKGNKPDKNVQLVVELPQGTQLVDVNAPVEYRVSGQQLVFAAVSEMRNKDPYNYRFQVKHNQAGSQVVRAKVTSSNWPKAVVKEEGTLVYNDQQ